MTVRAAIRFRDHPRTKPTRKRRMLRKTKVTTGFKRMNIGKPGHRQFIPITSDEMQSALTYWIKDAQSKYFTKEISAIQQNVELPPDSSIRTLSPFFDDKGILRLQGRLRNAQLPEHTQRQIILPTNSRIAELIRVHAHKNTVNHGGTQITMTAVRTDYWMPRLRQAVKADISKCIECFRQKQATTYQQMGDLPSVRVNKANPFAFTGVDFAGPINIRKLPGRPPTIRSIKDAAFKEPSQIKAWIVIFVCLTTKAVHIEIIKGLATEEFLAAFARFTGRRGRCKQLWSDNGTSFIGASKELQRVLREWQSTETVAELAKTGTTWRFITPAAPHQGGIWEAGVKSVKHHLKRIVGRRILTGDQLYTVLVQIEGCLNSRPLCPITDDPTDLTPLTPAHFLIGRSIIQPPLSDEVTTSHDQRLTLWGLQQKMLQEFWKSWKDEYLTSLQPRHKWYRAQVNLKIGDMVIMLKENTPPSLWPVGRVINVFKGADNFRCQSDQLCHIHREFTS